MANGNLLPNWSFRRKLPDPFEDYTDDPVRKDVYSKYCTQPQKRSTLHAATLRAVLAYMELEAPSGGKHRKSLALSAARTTTLQLQSIPAKLESCMLSSITVLMANSQPDVTRHLPMRRAVQKNTC